MPGQPGLVPDAAPELALRWLCLNAILSVDLLQRSICGESAVRYRAGLITLDKALYRA